jgi:Tfp pilus assembly protein PilV
VETRTVTFGGHDEMKRTIKNNRRRNRGESLTETLVAVLIVALAMVMLVSMLMAANRLVENSKVQFDNNMTEKNAVEDETGDKDNGKVQVTGTLQDSSGAEFYMTIKESNLQEDVTTYSVDGNIWKYR